MIILSSVAVDLIQTCVDPISWIALAAAAALIAYASFRLKTLEEPRPCEQETLPPVDWNRSLTERQRIFVAGILAGKSAKEIAAGEGVAARG
jgi:hypothetical protein